ncbi:MAG: MaoC family dehydratase [Rhizobiaceae bacterium]|nr:MaoC family dehydratase [Rhizobiaceae bacterium]
MTLDDYLGVGEPVGLGSHLFTPEAIKAFAAKFDPQRFHVDEDEARHTVFGGLCASGWHTAAAWMKCNVATPIAAGKTWSGDGPTPVFGPSPGFTNLKWPRPVYAGETVAYTRTILGHRALASRPGWRIVTMSAGGTDSAGAPVLSFESAVLMKAM